MGRTAFRVISPGHSAWGLASPREVKSGRHHGQAVVSNALVARTSSRFAADFVSNRDSRPACRYQALLRAGRLGLAKPAVSQPPAWTRYPAARGDSTTCFTAQRCMRVRETVHVFSGIVRRARSTFEASG